MGKERGACFRMDARLTLCANMILDLSLVAMTHGRIQVRFLCFSCFHFIPELSYSDCGSSARSPVYRCPMALNPSRRAPQPEFVQKDYPRQAVGEQGIMCPYFQSNESSEVSWRIIFCSVSTVPSEYFLDSSLISSLLFCRFVCYGVQKLTPVTPS